MNTILLLLLNQFYKQNLGKCKDNVNNATSGYDNEQIERWMTLTVLTFKTFIDWFCALLTNEYCKKWEAT